MGNKDLEIESKSCVYIECDSCVLSSVSRQHLDRLAYAKNDEINRTNCARRPHFPRGCSGPNGVSLPSNFLTKT
jgi:hypothetical protein